MLETILTFGAVVLLYAFAAPVSAQTPTEEKPVVVFETTKGKITIELDPVKAPISVKNFLEYVDKGHYDGTVFHRVIPEFMVQGGGYTPDGKEKEKGLGRGIKNEGGNGLKNVRGSVAMARTPNPDSATAQFFINVVDNGFLDRDQAQDGFGYAVFGRVIEGMDVVDAIVSVPTANRPMPNWPKEPIVITSAKRKAAAN